MPNSLLAPSNSILNPQSSILVIGPSWIGDMVMAQSLFKIIKQYQPHLIIDVLAPAWSKPLLACMPEVNNAIESPFKHGELRLLERYKLAKQLRQKKYQQVIVIPNSLKSALIPFFTKIPKRTGYRGEMRWGLLNDIRICDEKKYPLRIQHYANLGLMQNQQLPSNLSYPALQISPSRQKEILQKFQVKSDKKILAICPGAEYGPAKRWPIEYFAEVAQTKIAEGWEVYIFGSEKEQALAARIQQMTGQKCLDLTGKTSLEEAIYLLSAVTAVVTNDSGLMHIAAALQKPLVALYGSTPASNTPPLSYSAKILSLNLVCSPCMQRECPLGHFQCMRDLTPGSILEILKGF